LSHFPLTLGEGTHYSLSPRERVRVRGDKKALQVPSHPDPLPEGEGERGDLPRSGGEGVRNLTMSS